MVTVSTSSLRAALLEFAYTPADKREPLPIVLRTVRTQRAKRYPRAIQWHINRGLFSPCAY